MTRTDKPETLKTNEPHDLGQISEEQKGKCILRGSRAKLKASNPDMSDSLIWCMAAGEIAELLAMLSGTSKDGREWAKKKVRELVKLGLEVSE